MSVIRIHHTQDKINTDKSLQDMIKLVQGLTVQLRSQQISWLEDFIHQGGMYQLTCLLASTINFFSFFGHYSSSTENGQPGTHQTTLNNVEQLRSVILMSFTCLLNFNKGIEAFLQQRDAIRTMALVMDGASLKNRSTILLLLALLCHHSGQEAFELILDAMNHYKLVKREKARFQDLGNWILNENAYASGTSGAGTIYTGGSHGRASIEFRVNALMFINALITSTEDPKVAARIQQEFVNLGLVTILNSIDTEDPDLVVQISTFKELIANDLSHHFETLTSNSSDPLNIIEVLNGQLTSVSQKHFASMLNALLPISQSYEDTRTSIASRASVCVDNDIQETNFALLAKIIRQMVESIDSRGRLKDWTEETERLKQQVKTQQTSLNNLDEKLKAEKKKLETMLQNPQCDFSNASSEFEILKDLLSPLANFVKNRPSQQDVAVSIMNVQQATTTTTSGVTHSKPLPTPPGDVKTSTQSTESTTGSLVTTTTTTSPPPPPPPPSLQETQSVVMNSSSSTTTTTSTTTGMVPPPPPGVTSGSIGGVPPPPPGMTTGGGVPPPPPGMAGGMPPPPPPGMTTGGVSQTSLPPLPTYSPNTNLRNVHIDPINKRVIKETVFIKKGVIDKLKQIHIDESRISELFGVEKDSTHSKAMNASSNDKAEKVSLIDAKRAYNIGIQLASMRLNFDAIRKAVITMDETAMSKNQINTLKSIVPTEEEVNLVSAFDGDASQLAEPDRFFYIMKDVSKIKERMEAWSFKLRYEDDLASLKPDIESLRLATHELKESKKFVKFLAVVLSIANYLNAKGRQKDQYGFHLSSLHKLKDTKASKGNEGLSLLHYLVEYIDTHQKDLSEFYDDMPNIPSAKKASIAQIKEVMQMIKASSNSLGETLAAIAREEDSPIHKQDKFIEKMKPFYEQTKADLGMLEEKLKKTQEGLEELAILFDEDKNLVTTKPEDFFTKLDEFFEMFKSARKFVQERKKKQEEALKKQQKPNTQFNVNNSTEKGVLEGLENSLRDGTAFKKRSLRANANLLAQELSMLKK